MSVNIAEQLEDDEQFDKAYEEYKKIYAQKPDNLEILERLGHLAAVLHKENEALEYYNKILELDPQSVLAYEQLMDIYFHTDRYKYYVCRGNLHILEEQLSHAINDFKKALDKAQTEVEMNSTRFVLASLYEQTGKPHQAIDVYLRILDTSSANELVFLKLANIYVMEDAITSAIEILKRAELNGFQTEAVKETLAQLYLKNNEPEEARKYTNDDLVKVKSLLDEERNSAAFEILDKIKDSSQKNAKYHSLLAQYYFNIKQFDKSLECVEEFDKLEKDSPLSYQMRALIFEEKKDEFNAHMNWAKYNLYLGDRDVALNEYFLAYQVNDKDAALTERIAELLNDTNDKHQAAEFYEKLVDIDPKNKRALEKVAEFKENIGDYRSQTEVLEQLYELDIKNASVIKKLAKAYEKTRNKEKALEFYNKFIANSPVNDDYEEVKQKIKKLEASEFEEDEGIIGKIMKLFSRV